MAKQPLMGSLQKHRVSWGGGGEVPKVPLNMCFFKSYLPAILYSESHINCKVKEEKHLRETDKRRGGTTD